MPKLPLPGPLGYALAVGGVALATAARLALAPVLGPHDPLATFYVAAIVTAWACGPGPSAVALGLGALAADQFFLGPIAEGTGTGAVRLAGLLLYLFVGGAAILVGEAERRVRRAAEGERGKLDALLDSAPVGVAFLDPGLRYLRVNEAMARLGGLTAAEVVGRGASDLATGLWPGLAAVYRRVLETGEPALGREIEAGSAGSAGGVRVVVADAYPVRVAGRGVVGVGVAVTDVTERRRTEGSLSEAHGRFRDLAEAIPQVAYVTDAEGRLAYVNRRWTEYTGLDLPRSQADADLDSVVHPDDRAGLHAAWARSFAAGSDFEAQVRIRRASDGAYRWFLSRAVAVRDDAGRVVRWFGTSTDIDDQKAAEEALRRGEAEYRALFEGAGVGNIEVVPDGGRLLRVNRRFCELTGRAAEELRGATLPGLAAPDDRGLVEAALASCARGERPAFEVEARFVREDGSILWGRLAGAPIRDASGRVRAVLGALADITENKRAEREMAGLVQRLTTLMDNTPLAVIEWDAGLRVARWSGRAEEVFGWPAAAALGRPIGAFPPVHEGDRAEAEATTARLLDPANRFDVSRLRHVTEAGRVIHCEWYNSVLHDESGRLVAVLSLVLDVTERVRVEEDLRAERERVRRVADAVPALIAYVDADGRYRLNNRAYERWFGLPREEVVGKHMREVLGESAWEALRPHVEEALRGRAVSYEAEVPYRDAGRRWIAATYTPDVGEGGEVRGLFVHVTDITDRHRREEESRAGEARFRQLAEAMPQIVWVADPAGRNIYINRHWAEYTGRTAEQGLGAGWIDAIHPDDRPGLRARWRGCHREGVPYEAEYRLLGKDGSYRWHLVRGVPIRDDSGRVARWYGSSTDIDEPKRLAEALREDDRRKDEFLAMLAHELRNPLAPIRNAVSVMGMAEDNRETLRWARDVIDRQARHLTSLVDDLLDVSRITRGKIALERAPLGVSTFLHAAVEAARPLIDARRHRLEVSIPPGPIRVLGDPTRLTQVVQNLLNNAAKYTPEGGQIRLDVGREGDEVSIRVRDDGLGIPAEMLPRVFDLFTQVDRSIDRSEGGLGIGLTLVRRLVEMHGGTVEARSDGVGAGSEFTVRLPLLPGPTAATAPAPAPPAREEGAARRVLVVDDNADSAETLARLLRRMGHEVAIAHDGPSAIAAALAAPVDLALLDIGLPGMDGYEVARRLRGEPALDGIRLVALTGYGSESDRRRSAAAGFDDHFVKPVEFDALRRALERSRVGSA